MAYAVCVRASVVDAKCWRDNSFTGTLRIDGKDYQFKTRHTITKAVNARYTNIAWKPGAGEEVIFDGEIFQDQIIIDQIERWNPCEFSPLDRHPELVERLVNGIESLSPMNKAWRIGHHEDDGIRVTVLRWLKNVYLDPVQKKEEIVLDAICAEREIRFAARLKTTGEVVANAEAPILPFIAEMLGIPRVEPLPEKKAEPARAKHSDKGNPNKWIPGKPYRPIGMPEPIVDERSNLHDPFDPFREIPEDDIFGHGGQVLEVVEDEIPF